MTKGVDAFYKIHRDERWMGTPYEVGGRDLDVQQIGSSLESEIQSNFPDGAIPEDLEITLCNLKYSLKEAARLIDEAIYQMSMIILKRRDETIELEMPNAPEPIGQAMEPIFQGDLIGLNPMNGRIYKFRPDGKYPKDDK